METTKNFQRLIGVYGTLKDGWGNHRLLENEDTEFVCNAYVGISKIDSVGFPRIKLGDTYHLHVEVYKITSQKVAERVDALEGVYEGEIPTFYARVPATVYKLEDGRPLEIEIYEYVGQVSDNINETCKSLPDYPDVYTWVR